jgi:SAM-dependent methyltransferase
MNLTTPLRQKYSDSSDGIVMLRDHESSYADGAEDRVLEIVRNADDVSSTSDELIAHATDWPTRYHLDPARANIVRALDLRPDARVLEIGAGCGAVTRYLAERVGLVDALEPVPARARTIAARTRELSNTEVFVGHVEDVPDEAAYDVVVVIGVLEYVASGADEQQPYVDFLAGIASRLVPGGTLVLAIENKLGVKYLAGSPEDHSNRVADSMESYPFGSPARTFSRQELVSLMLQAGLTAETRIALPDYKMTEAVVDPMRVPVGRERLMRQVSDFPSPDWVPSVGRFADEKLFWESLIDAGLAGETGNSFLVLATKAGEGADLWRPGLVGTYWPVGVAGAQTHATDVIVSTDGLQLVSSPTNAPAPDRAGVAANTTAQRDVGQPNFVDRARRADQAQLTELLRGWESVVAAREAAGDGVAWDLVPHRMVVSHDGTMQPCRVEWHLTGHDWDVVRRRGVVLLADRLARATSRDRWDGVTDVRGLATELGVSVGLPADGSWIDTFVEEEAELVSGMRVRRLDRTQALHVQEIRDDLGALLARATGPVPLLGDRLVEAQAVLAATRLELDGARTELAAAVADRARLRKQVASLRRTVKKASAPAPASRRLRSRAPRWLKRAAAPARRIVAQRRVR